MDLTALKLERYHTARLRDQCDARLERLDAVIAEVEAQAQQPAAPTPPPDPPEDL